jgi:raffinose/stachyose/melibiose transport system permease protein
MRSIKKEFPYLLFVLPAFILYTIVTIIPVLTTFVYSFTNFNGMTHSFNFVGLQNYIKVFTTNNVTSSFINSIVFGFVTPIVVTILAIPLALLLDSKMKTRNIQRAIFFFPAVISSLFLGYIWNFILSPSDFGLINSIRISLGQGKLLLLADPHMAMILLILANVWCVTGWHACIYLANIQMIDKSYYEAAEIDGAGGFAKFRTITLPFLAPAMTVSVMLLLTGSLKAFDLPFALTNGGPGYATTMVTQTIITEGINSDRVGFASSMSFLFLLVISFFALFQVRIMRRREENLS